LKTHKLALRVPAVFAGHAEVRCRLAVVQVRRLNIRLNDIFNIVTPLPLQTAKVSNALENCGHLVMMAVRRCADFCRNFAAKNFAAQSSEFLAALPLNCVEKRG
jgi:hypothetical protein